MTRALHLHIARFLVVLGIAMLALGIFARSGEVYALPEYANRTGEPCATCHVSPGGGGPRTLRGMLWTAQGRPDKVPVVENSLLAPGILDPLELYDRACAGCHGRKGEGLYGTPLRGYTLTEDYIHTVVEHGVPRKGMPSFTGQLTDDQMAVLVEFVRAMSAGEIIPPDSYPLGPAVESCESATPADGVCSPIHDTSVYQGN